jgi:preprotein translocase subunit SecD
MYNNQPVISFELKREDAQTFADFTSQNVNKFLTIVLDGKVISSPRINEPITDGKGVISGNFTIDSANALAIQLKYGALPVPLKVVEYKLIGATLGEDSLQKSLVAGLIGLTIAALFMLIYYRLPV